MAHERASVTADLVCIDALGPQGEFRTRNREVITSTAGVPVAELSLVPPLYVSRTIGAQRKAKPLSATARELALVN
ncbi:MAG: aldehyde dehydrogenase, partial [Mycobacterium sp.]